MYNNTVTNTATTYTTNSFYSQQQQQQPLPLPQQQQQQIPLPPLPLPQQQQQKPVAIKTQPPQLEQQLHDAHAVSSQEMLQRLHMLEQIVLQQSSTLRELFKGLYNVDSIISSFNQHEPKQTAGNSTIATTMDQAQLAPYDILLSLSTVMISVRDKKTLHLLGTNLEMSKQVHNRKFVDFQTIPEGEHDGEAFRKACDPFFLLLMLNIIRSEAKQYKLMKCKILWRTDKPMLVETTLHVEQDYVWTEHRPLNPPILDDEFVLDDYVHQKTFSISLPPNGSYDQWKQLYEEPSKIRYYHMMMHFMNENIVFGQQGEFMMQLPAPPQRSG